MLIMEYYILVRIICQQPKPNEPRAKSDSSRLFRLFIPPKKFKTEQGSLSELEVIVLKSIKLQAHKGVASECPENTMSAFKRAVVQKYDVIELDLGYTSDGKIIVLHDEDINRTARNKDGTRISEPVRINEITYSEALDFDFGIGFSNKFRGEKIPLFKEVLDLAAESGMRLKIDNKIQGFPDEMLEKFFAEIRGFEQYLSMTSNNSEFTEMCLKRADGISTDYDGVISDDVLNKLCATIPPEKLTVWLPYKCKNTSWVKIPFADEKLSEKIKSRARLGIWLLSDYADFREVSERFSPYIVETDGTLKPHINAGSVYDMHTHSEYSHDSECKINDMAISAKSKGLTGVAVTDHCDVEYFDTIDLDAVCRGSVAAAKKANEESDMKILHGIEIGEGFWHPEVTENILKTNKFDAVIGSVHAAKYEGLEMPYSGINFAELDKATAKRYLNRYFDDMLIMLEKCDIDILAHLTCPLRYINGKYGMEISADAYTDKIDKILEYIIAHGIALEVNSSCMFNGSAYAEFMPEERIIRRYKELGGYLITCASDAHIAENCANAFKQLYAFLSETGFENIYYYENRHAVQCALH